MEKYETFWRRVGAKIVDSVILLPVGWVAASIAEFIIPSAKITVILFVPGLISALYYILLHAYGGQTIGKMAFKVEVLDDSETRISLGQSILRSLPYLLLPMFAVSFSTAGGASDASTATWAGAIYALTSGFYFVSAIVCLASVKNRALHDFIAGTVVVRTDV